MATADRTYEDGPEAKRDIRRDRTSDNRFVEVLTGPVARWLFAIPFMIFGVIHFAMGSDMAGMVPIPGGVLWVYLTGAALFAAGIAFAANRFVRVAGILLALMLMSFVVLIHLPGLADQATMQGSMTAALKDTALAAGALILAGRAAITR